MCPFRIAIAGQHVAILTGFLVIQLVGTVALASYLIIKLPFPFLSLDIIALVLRWLHSA